LLTNGKVLVIGGYYSTDYLSNSKGERAESWNSEFLWISRILWDSIGFSTSQDSLGFPEMP
jgi:hypothetical protein